MVSKNIIKKMMKLNDNLLHLKRNKGLRNGMEENPRRCYNAKSKLCLLTCPTGWNLALKMKCQEPLLSLMVPVSCSLHYVSRRNEKYSKTGDENGCKLWTISKWLKKLRWLGLLNLKKKKKKTNRHIRGNIFDSDKKTKVAEKVNKELLFAF